MSFQHDAAGREVIREFAGGGRLEQGFDDAHRLVSQGMGAAGDPSADPVRVIGRSFQYRVDGALAGVGDTLASTSRRFDLDLAGRVVGVRAEGWTEGYAYDLSGRLARDAAGLVGGQSAAVRAYDGTRVTRAAGVSYGHDRQGRVVTRTRKRLSRKPETWQFRYDADDRMVAASSGGQQWSYTCDPFGRRISKQRHGAGGEVVEQTLFSWDGDQLIEQAHTAGPGSAPTVTTWDYLPGSWNPVSQTVRTGGDVDAQFYAIVSDLMGTPTELVTADGRRVVWTGAEANVWGAPRHKAANTSARYGTAGVDCPIRFPGQYADDETGLHYNRHRYYDPVAARYTTPDPLGLAPADDPYGYVLNPTGWADPLGLTPCDPANLLGHEANGGHTIERHVGKSDDYLEGRGIPEASTFPDLATASQETASNLRQNAEFVQSWLRSAVNPTVGISGRLSPGAGRTYVRELDQIVSSTGIESVLHRTINSEVGYLLVTSFPTP